MWMAWLTGVRFVGLKGAPVTSPLSHVVCFFQGLPPAPYKPQILSLGVTGARGMPLTTPLGRQPSVSYSAWHGPCAARGFRVGPDGCAGSGHGEGPDSEASLGLGDRSRRQDAVARSPLSAIASRQPAMIARPDSRGSLHAWGCFFFRARCSACGRGWWRTTVAAYCDSVLMVGVGGHGIVEPRSPPPYRRRA